MMRPTNPLIGFPHVQWREVTEAPTDQIGEDFNRTCPRAGETRWANLNISHRTPIGGRLWLLYEPWFALYNGLGQFPAELDKWALVECEILARHQPTWVREEDEQFMSAHPEMQAAKEELEAVGAIFSEYPADQYKGWVQVLCNRVVPLWDIPNHFPLTNLISSTFPDSGEYFDKEESDRCICCSASDRYGATHEWWVIAKTTPRRLVLYSFFDGWRNR